MPTLLDANGHVLAHDVPACDVLLTPQNYKALSRADLLTATDGLPEVQTQLRHRLSERAPATWSSGPQTIATGLPETLCATLVRRWPGVLRQQPSRLRLYSQGSLTAHVLGHAQLGHDGGGQDGADAEFKPHRQAASEPVRLTLTLSSQRALRDALLQAFQHAGVSAAAGMVLDPKTGRIEAMVSLPDFDPNVASSFRRPYQPERLRNEALVMHVAAEEGLTPLRLALDSFPHDMPVEGVMSRAFAVHGTEGANLVPGLPLARSSWLAHDLVQEPNPTVSLLQLAQAYLPAVAGGRMVSLHLKQQEHCVRPLPSTGCGMAGYWRQGEVERFWRSVPDQQRDTHAQLLALATSSQDAGVAGSRLLVQLSSDRADEARWLVAVLLRFEPRFSFQDPALAQFTARRVLLALTQTGQGAEPLQVLCTSSRASFTPAPP